MAASVSAQYAFGCEVAETLALGLDNVTDRAFTHSVGADAATLNASSSPAPATKPFSDTIALAAGISSLDLTSLAGPASTTVTFDGLKVQLAKFKCPDTNTGGITVTAKDASTGYNLFGANNAAVTTQSLAPAARTASANGASADLQNVETALAIVEAGTLTDGTHTPKIQESANDADWSDVGAGDQIGTFAALSSNTVQSVRYIGVERYVRVVITVTGGPATGLVGSAAIVARPAKLTIMPGMVQMLYADDELENVDSTHKDLTFTGTGTDGIRVILVAG